jgi:hypothetical protein
MARSVPVAVVPSFLAKLWRGKKHLVDLEAEVGRFADQHPYTVRSRIEGKKKRKTWRIEFTADPAHTDIPILAADVIYNLRSSLDHLMSELVAPKDRGSAIFPIFFQGVWEAIVPGESQQRIKERMRWASDVKTLSDEAITVLKTLQPPDEAWKETQGEHLRFLNRLSNRDRHEKLPVIAHGIAEPQFAIRMPDGTTLRPDLHPDTPGAFENHAHLSDVPEQAVDVQMRGTPVVGIRMGDPKERRYAEIPRSLRLAAETIENRVIPSLAPFVRS